MNDFFLIPQRQHTFVLTLAVTYTSAGASQLHARLAVLCNYVIRSSHTNTVPQSTNVSSECARLCDVSLQAIYLGAGMLQNVSERLCESNSNPTKQHDVDESSI